MTEEMLLSDIALISEIILEHGVKYAPFLDRLEREFALLKERKGDVIARAQKHLAAAKLRANGDDLPRPVKHD
jgi:hypothetical protein